MRRISTCLIFIFFLVLGVLWGCRTSHYRELPWVVVRTDRLVFHTFSNSPYSINEIKVAEETLDHLAGLFQTEPEHPIEVFQYPDVDTMWSATNASLSFTKENEVHYYGGVLAHELTHVFIDLFGSPPFFIHEGLAMGLAAEGRIWEKNSLTGRPIHDVARELFTFFPRTSLRNIIQCRHLGTVPKRLRIRLFYGHASFFKYLVDELGIETMKSLITETPRSATPSQVAGKLEETYGEKISDLEKAWKSFLFKGTGNSFKN